MALVLLRAPLADLAGGREHPVEGGTVKEALVALESTCPTSRGGCSTSGGRSAGMSTSM